jgi:basic amino acid/polyamine antiporter, APA family
MVTTLGLVTNQAPGLPDAVLSGLAAMMGAGLLVGIAPAAELAGTWLLAGLALAALVAVACGLSISDSVTPLLVLGRSAGAAAIAAAFGRYLVPEHPAVGAVAVLAVTTTLCAAGGTPSPTLIRAGAVLVLAVFAVFVAACFAITPPVNPSGADEPAGLPAATALLVFGFLGFDRGVRTRRHRFVTIGAALLVYLAVAGAALHQLGSARLALSPVPLRDALIAADASGIDRILTVGAALATVLALLSVLSDLRADTTPVLTGAAGAAAALGILVLKVPVLMAVAVALMLGHQLLVRSRRRSARTRPRSTRY